MIVWAVVIIVSGNYTCYVTHAREKKGEGRTVIASWSEPPALIVAGRERRQCNRYGLQVRGTCRTRCRDLGNVANVDFVDAIARTLPSARGMRHCNEQLKIKD